MALNLPISDNANRVPIIKYDSRAGRAFRVDRRQVDGRWVNEDPVEITNVFQAIFDMENVETGWLHFPQGAAPDIRTVKDGQALPDRPSDKHRQGYRVLMLLGKQAGGDVREMASSARVSIQGMNDLDDLWKAGRAQNPGMLPVVRLVGTKAIPSTGKANGQTVTSTNYQPIWAIAKWVPRPPELQPAAIAQLTERSQQQAAQAPQQPAYQGAQAAQPPPLAQPPLALAPAQPAPPAPEPQRVLASVDDDF
jgi:hypothetical protein